MSASCRAFCPPSAAGVATGLPSTKSFTDRPLRGPVFPLICSEGTRGRLWALLTLPQALGPAAGVRGGLVAATAWLGRAHACDRDMGTGMLGTWLRPAAGILPLGPTLGLLNSAVACPCVASSKLKWSLSQPVITSNYSRMPEAIPMDLNTEQQARLESV